MAGESMKVGAEDASGCQYGAHCPCGCEIKKLGRTHPLVVGVHMLLIGDCGGDKGEGENGREEEWKGDSLAGR
jgi:hypothetical protein